MLPVKFFFSLRVGSARISDEPTEIQGFLTDQYPAKNWAKWFDCGPHKLVNHNNRPTFIRIWGVITPLCLLLQAKKWVTSREILVFVRWPPCGAAFERLVDMKGFWIKGCQTFFDYRNLYIIQYFSLNKPKKIWLFTPPNIWSFNIPMYPSTRCWDTTKWIYRREVFWCLQSDVTKQLRVTI